ncbi:MAG: hypothetical protein ACTS5P_01275 [Candidatus Hodgkinia cicadicola]
MADADIDVSGFNWTMRGKVVSLEHGTVKFGNTTGGSKGNLTTAGWFWGEILFISRISFSLKRFRGLN